MRFYKYPLNYPRNRNSETEVGDNNYNTSTRRTGVVCYVDSVGDGTGDPQTFSSFFIKGKNIASGTVTATGSTTGFIGLGLSFPDTIRNDSNEEVSVIIDGSHNELFDLHNTPKENAVSLIFEFNADPGQTVEIQEIMVLDEILRIEENAVHVNPVLTYISSGLIQRSATGRETEAPPLNNARDRWQYESEIHFSKYADGKDIRAKLDQLISFMRANRNFVGAVEPTRYPDLVAPCIFPDRERQISYLVRDKGAGRSMRVRIRES